MEVWIRPDDSVAGIALHAVHAALELEPAVGAVAVDLDDRLLDAVDAGLVQVEDLGREAVARGVAQVHPVQLGREERRLLAARAGPDLHDHVAVVVGVAWQEQDLEVLEQLASRRASSSVISSRTIVAHLVVRVARVAELARAGQLRAGRLERAVGLDDGLEPGELAAEPADLARDRRRPRVATSSACTSSYCRGDLRELGVEVAHVPGGGSVVGAGAAAHGRFDRSWTIGAAAPSAGPRRIGSRSNGVEPSGTVSPSASSACSIETIATSIMSSDGCLVVIIWTRRPG